MTRHDFAVLRNGLSKRLEELNDIKRELEDVKNKEEESINNTPLQFQDSERFIESESAVADMEEAMDIIDAAITSCNTVIKSFDEMDEPTVLNDVITLICQMLGEAK